VKLNELLKKVNVLSWHAAEDTEIAGVCLDSRKAGPGDLFTAIRGFESDGHAYIPMAVSRGAACVLCEEAPSIPTPYVLVEDSRRALAEVSAAFYGEPAARMQIIGVTGTNGKTTTTTLIKSILEQTIGAKVGLIGTNRNMIGQEVVPTERTTPESLELQALFARMADAGCTHVVMEVSSHALCLDRVWGVPFAVGVFTNLTQDHLDFHKTMDAYAAAKAQLFRQSAKAVINLDDPYAEVMLQAAECPVYTFSADKNEADLSARNIVLRAEGVSFCALTIGKLEKIRLGIPGAFSVYNALAALAAVLNLGVPLEDAAAALSNCRGVMGRAEVVPTGRDFTVLIDYAHTPDALENILRTVRGFAAGRVVLLFGCGGDRDRTKRPIMGKIAAELADYVYVTSDNPRTEQPDAIIQEILVGMEDTKTPYTVIENRREAIFRAVADAQPGDVIILAGKGHETYQEICREKHHFDEREVVADALQACE